MAQRGRGPPQGKQPAPMPHPDHPQYRMLATGVWYLLRVSEVMTLDMEDVVVKQSTAGWTAAVIIRSSKTDPEALSETVARDCVCLNTQQEEARALCPVHILCDQVGQRLGELRAVGYRGHGAPLFTGEGGERLTQRQVLSAVEKAALDAGEQLQDEGRARYGTHSLRVAGAVLAFQAGLQETEVRSLGRWKTEEAMLAYLRGVPLIRASSTSTQMVRAMLNAGGTPLKETNFQPLVQGGKMTIGRTRLADLSGKTNGEPEREEDWEGGIKIRHSLTGLVHRQGNLRGPAEGWTTRCGWRWAKLGMAGDFKAEDGPRCGKCFADN